MTVRENVQSALTAGGWVGLEAWRSARALFPDRADALLDQVGLAGQAERGAAILAYGDLKRLELAMALAGTPRLLLMDEPTAGMAPQERTALMRLVRDLASAKGVAVLFTEHDMDVVFGVADRILVLAHGELVAAGPPAGDARRPEGARGVSGHGRAVILEVSGLEVFYGQAHILHDVGFSVAKGEAVALLGRNGAGKSTTLKTLAGLIRPAAGQVRFAGVDVTGWEPYRIARAGMGWVPEDRRVFADLTIMENLECGRQPPRPGQAPWMPERLFQLFPNLAELQDRPRRPHQRRRAADAYHRPHPDGPTRA